METELIDSKLDKGATPVDKRPSIKKKKQFNGRKRSDMICTDSA